MTCAVCSTDSAVDSMFKSCSVCVERFLSVGADSLVRLVSDRVSKDGWKADVIVKPSQWLPVLQAVMRQEPPPAAQAQIAFAIRCTKPSPSGAGELVSVTLIDRNALLATCATRKRSRPPLEPRQSTRPRTPVNYQKLNDHDILGAIARPPR